VKFFKGLKRIKTNKQIRKVITSNRKKVLTIGGVEGIMPNNILPIAILPVKNIKS
tara:strand:- start:261 stop:425 length:165 start_codon:yes stop_codon:yes gene_type:complete